jgi:hypothetical protein
MGRRRGCFFSGVSRGGAAGRACFLKSAEFIRAAARAGRALGVTNMMRIGLYGLGLLVIAMQGVGRLQGAEPKVSEKDKASEKAGDASKALPFVGVVGSVDLGARSFTLNGKAKERLFKVTDKTEILMDGKPVGLSAMTVGAKVQGSAVKHETEWEARKVTIGPKEAPGAPKK